jgi:hypothetical protein
MRKLIISESEKRNILKVHGVIKEQDENLTAAEMLAKIQSKLGTSGDRIIGPKTTDAIVNVLQGTSSFDFSCIKNGDRVWFDSNNSNGYKLGDYIYDQNGNYYNVNNKNEIKKYTCQGGKPYAAQYSDIDTTQSEKTKQEKLTKVKSEYEKLKSGGFSDSEIPGYLKGIGYSDEEINSVIKTTIQPVGSSEKVTGP